MTIQYVDACEHCDGWAPRGERFCSMRCQKEDSFGVLLPCPFCGKDPRTLFTISNNFVDIWCDTTTCPTLHAEDATEKAFNCWNDRVSAP